MNWDRKIRSLVFSRRPRSFHWFGDGFFSDRIVRIPWPYDTAIRSGVMGFDPTRFQSIDLGYGPTLFCLHQMELATFVYGGYKQAFAAANRPSLVSHLHYVIHESLPYPMASTLSRALLQINSCLVSDMLVVNSHHTQNMIRDTCSLYLKPERVEEIMGKCKLLYHGLVGSEVKTKIRSHPKPVILYNHRFEAYKNFRTTAEVIEGLKSEFDFEVWITQTEGQRAGLFPLDRIVGHPERAVYLDNIAVPAINTINSAHETFCISLVDSLALGHLAVAPNAITFPELLPEGYPYLFNSVKEQRDMLAGILRTWPVEYKKWSKKLRQHVAKKFSSVDYIPAYAGMLEEAANAWRAYGKREKTEKGLDAFFSGLKQGMYTLHDLHTNQKKRMNLGDQAFPPRRLVREAAALGAKVHWDQKRQSVLIEWNKGV